MGKIDYFELLKIVIPLKNAQLFSQLATIQYSEAHIDSLYLSKFVLWKA